MKTLQIGLDWFPERGGGLDRFYYDCSEQLPKAGVEFKGLVAGSERIISSTNGRISAFATAESSILKRLMAVRKNFKQTLAQENFNLIVSHFALYTLPLLDLLEDRPLVIHFQGSWALESAVEADRDIAIWIKQCLEKKIYNRSHKFVVLSRNFRDLLHQEYQVPLDKIDVIPGAVDVERFNINESQNEARQKLGWSSDKLIIFCVRRLARRMGLENLIVAMKTVCSKYPDTLLYIAGKGELADSLQAKIAELGLENNIRLLGYVSDNDLPLCYRAADFSIVPTVALEGFGLIVIESLATGTPVLGTPVGGIPEVLRPFSPDLLFHSCETKDLASGILEVLSGKRHLPSSRACLNYVQTNYTWELIAPQIKAVYQQAIENHACQC